MRFVLWLLLFASILACAQEPAAPAATAPPAFPYIYLAPKLDLNGGGFQRVSGSITGGFGQELDHFFWDFSGSYRAAKKATYCIGQGPCVVNPHGDTRSLDAYLGVRSSGGWIALIDGDFSSLHTTLYDKTGSSIGVGGGKDFMNLHFPSIASKLGESARVTLTYAIPFPLGTHDVEHGFTAHIQLPSPAKRSTGWFWDEYVHAGWVCNPTCNHDASTSMGVMFRWNRW